MAHNQSSIALYLYLSLHLLLIISDKKYFKIHRVRPSHPTLSFLLQQSMTVNNQAHN